jgi:NADH:ubiquinone oxidoreductase subunit 5 (subunit L)/multisubunit Na+/H+ antiporter MnhA subunit
MKYLMIISLFVILHRGINTLYEIDMKKLIALRTLSHMGFICFGISLGLVNLAYLHLIVHALFKSTLFMAIGMIIVNNNHYQDIRFIRYGNKLNLFSFRLMYFRVLNLLGIPMIRRYFSKDLILEIIRFTKNFFLIELLIYIIIIFSFYYRMKLFTYCSNELNNSPYKSMNKINFSLILSLMVIMSLNICFYKVFVNMILMEYIFFIPVNLANKILLFSLLIFILGIYLTTNLMNFGKHNYIYYNTIINLGFATKNIIRIIYYKSLNNSLGAEFMYNRFSLLELKAVNVGIINKLYSIIFIVNIFIYLLILSLLITLII